MALGKGETIGTAYVRILADGSGLPDSIEDEFDRAEPLFETQGNEGGKAYEKAFADRIEKDQKISKSITGDIHRAFGKMDADATEFGERFQRRVSDAITNGLIDSEGTNSVAAREVGNRIARDIADGVNNGRAPNFTNLRQQIGKALRDIENDSDEFANNFRRDMDDVVRSVEKLAPSVQATDRQVEKAWKDIGTATRTTTLNFVKDVETMGRENDRLGNSFDSNGRKISGFSEKIGRAFGKGSRNDFLNFVGSMVGGITNLSSHLSRLLEQIPGFASEFSGMSSKILEGGTALAVFGEALGIVATLVVELAGVVTALASSLVFAASSAIPVIIGGLAALGAAAGVVGIAILGFKHNVDAMATLQDALQPLIDNFNELADVVAQTLAPAIANVLGAASVGLKALGPLVAGITHVFAQAADSVAGFIRSADFSQFAAVLSTQLPGIINSFLTATGNIFRSFTGLIEASLPVTQKFAGYLSDITDEFANWTSSAAGQTTLLSFFDKAAESAQAVAHAGGAIVAVIAQILDAAKPAGDTLFDEIGDSFDRLSAWLGAHQDAMADFFDDSKRIGEGIGNVVASIVGLFAALNTDANRNLAVDTLNTVVDVIKILTAVLGTVTKIIGPVVEKIASLLSAITSLGSGLVSALGSIGGFFTGLVSGGGEATASLDSLADSIEKVGIAALPLSSFKVISPDQLALISAAGISTGTYTAALHGNAAAIEIVKTKASELGSNYGNIVDPINRASEANQKWIRSMQEAADAAGHTNTANRQMGHSVDEFGHAIADAVQPLSAAAQSQKDLQTAIEEDIATMATATTTAEDYKKALDDLVDTDGDVFDAQRDLAQSFRDVKSGLKDSGTSLNVNTTAGNSNIDMIEDLINKNKDLIVSYKEDQNKGPGFLTQKLADLRAQMIKNLTQDGFNRDSIKSLLRTYGLTPKLIATLFKAEGTEPAKHAADDVKKHIDAIPLKPTSHMTVTGAEEANTLATGIKKHIDDIPLKPTAHMSFLGAGEANTAADGVTHHIKDIPTTWLSHINVEGADEAAGAANSVAAAVRNIPTTWTTHINVVNSGSSLPFQMGASGGVFDGARPMIIGEAGPEALVPLNRPLSQVDPAVRELSAIAQGLRHTPSMGSGGVVPGRSVDVGGITIVTPTENPRAVAQEVINQFAVSTYL